MNCIWINSVTTSYFFMAPPSIGGHKFLWHFCAWMQTTACSKYMHRLLQSKQLKGLSLLPLQFGLPASKHISLNRGCPCPRAGALWGLSMIPEPSVCSLEGKGWYLLSPSPPHSVLFKYLVEDDDILSIEVCAYVCLLETQGKNHKHCDSHCY